ncbi:MAG: hypothetical protein PHD06_05455 [Bacteroidales bacterium]|jgi:hypothetical protein|nr:hypothetical protein [Bacteroidales bacterium]MDD4384608.1 hypothetical protein [Bacteroidales bacterium]MDY0196872.1 hypothetical protein [Tenuifilaceae bacterium]
MKNLRLLVAALAIIGFAASCGGNSDKATKVDAIEVSVDSLLNDASALEGKVVRFTANVDHACMHGGKRLTVFGNVESKTLKIDATDSSPAFVSSLMGQKVEITGIVRKVAGSHVADCESDEGNEVPTFAYVVECINYSVVE